MKYKHYFLIALIFSISLSLQSCFDIPPSADPSVPPNVTTGVNSTSNEETVQLQPQDSSDKETKIDLDALWESFGIPKTDYRYELVKDFIENTTSKTKNEYYTKVGIEVSDIKIEVLKEFPEPNDTSHNSFTEYGYVSVNFKVTKSTNKYSPFEVGKTYTIMFEKQYHAYFFHVERFLAEKNIKAQSTEKALWILITITLQEDYIAKHNAPFIGYMVDYMDSTTSQRKTFPYGYTEKQVQEYAKKYYNVDNFVIDKSYVGDDGLVYFMPMYREFLYLSILEIETKDNKTRAVVQYFADKDKMIPSDRVEYTFNNEELYYHEVVTKIIYDSELERYIY